MKTILAILGGAQSRGLIKPGLGHFFVRIFSRVKVTRRRGS